MKRNWPVFFIVFTFIAGGSGTAYSDEQSVSSSYPASTWYNDKLPTYYFYNTESNFNNFAAVKMGFDVYLENRGGYLLQPFDLRENFEKAIKGKKGDIYLLSSWHLKELQQKKVPLKIALIATSKGNTTQRKVLSAKKEITDVSMLKNTVVAAAGSEEYVHSILKKILGKEQEALLKDIKILIVPKDIDAVMAVGFGMATAAISAESGLDKLAAMSPNYFKELHSLGFSEKDYLLIAATLNKPDQQETQLLEVLRKMSEEETGLESLKMLGIDGWRTVR